MSLLLLLSHHFMVQMKNQVKSFALNDVMVRCSSNRPPDSEINN